MCVKRQRNFIKTLEFAGVRGRSKALLSPYFAVAEAGWGADVEGK
jgi:hypothetical protein